MTSRGSALRRPAWLASGAALLTLAVTRAAIAQHPQTMPKKMAGSGALAQFFRELDHGFGEHVVHPIASVLFWDVAFWDNGEPHEVKLPFIVCWLILWAVFFTLRFRFINLRAFTHAIRVVRGDYDRPGDTGDVSHFQALSSALSATVGLGNIAGVAVAVGVGGPGAVLWMVLAGFLGMSSKFAECTLGQIYREVDEHGHISGGPMRYLRAGLTDLGMPKVGAFAAGLFAVLCVVSSFGGGNMFQANQSYAQVANNLPIFLGSGGALAYGIILAILVGVVILGGIKRIGVVAGYVVPLMCGVYLIAGAIVIAANLKEAHEALMSIIDLAFAPKAAYGGIAGVLITGFQRAAFSNEAGVGSAAIAHSAASTEEPVREGIVASLGPFIDTVIVCTMTGIVVVISGAYKNPAAEGVVMTSNAFATVLPWFPEVLAVAVFLFAYSTMISWSYYGERYWAYLFGTRTSVIYKALFLVFVVLGSVLKLGNVLDFSDLLLLGMSLPNLFGVVLLSNKIGRALKDYWSRYTGGEMPTERERALRAAGADELG